MHSKGDLSGHQARPGPWWRRLSLEKESGGKGFHFLDGSGQEGVLSPLARLWAWCRATWRKVCTLPPGIRSPGPLEEGSPQLPRCPLEEEWEGCWLAVGGARGVRATAALTSLHGSCACPLGLSMVAVRPASPHSPDRKRGRGRLAEVPPSDLWAPCHAAETGRRGTGCWVETRPALPSLLGPPRPVARTAEPQPCASSGPHSVSRC